jgi:hypothetical protein
MSLSTITTDLLPSTVPKLHERGNNWAIFALRFKMAVKAKSLWGHMDGTSTCPVPANPANVTAAETTAIADWEKNEALAQNLLGSRVPDSTAFLLANQTTAADMWNVIVREYTSKGAYAQTEMRTKFLESRCSYGGDVRAWLDSLRTKKEQLAAVGVAIEDKDYRSTIISSLPPLLATYASNQLSAARLQNPPLEIAPSVLMSMISEEYDRIKNFLHRPRASGAGKSSRNDDEAMAVGQEKPKGESSSRKPKPRGECWNCGETGHFRSKCPKPLKQKSKDPKAETSHAATDWDDLWEDGAFSIQELVENESSDDFKDMPDLVIVSDSEDELEEGEIEDELEEGELEDVHDDSDLWYYDHDDDDDEAYQPELYDESCFVDDDGAPKPTKELYDSGTTRHISPYKHLFNDFTEIQPRSFMAANKQSFSATATGNIIIDVPNGPTPSKLTLNDTLYSPDIGYTLVSIGRLDQSGHDIRFFGGKCTIKDPNGDLVGEIPISSNGLYRVAHGVGESANIAVETVTVMELHRRMGHIAPDAARKLVEDKLVTGIKLDTSTTESTFCESCVHAKATRKPVAKVREGERATEFAGEIHSDVWGPAPVAAIGGRRYYVTFTDDKTRLTFLYLIRLKSDTFTSYKTFEALCKTQFKAPVRILRSDRGGEYLDEQFIAHLEKAGTHHKLTVHDTSEHNGVAERLNRTIMEKVRAMLHASSLPKFLWGEAAQHAVWLKNRTPTKALKGTTPLELATGKKPDFRNLREWGCKVWVRTETGTKLGGRVTEGRFVGLDANSKGCRIYWPMKRSITVERNVYFNDTGDLEGEGSAIPEITTVNLPTSQPSQNCQFAARTRSPR